MEKKNSMNLSIGLRGKVLGVSTAASYTHKNGNNYVFCKVSFRGKSIADIAGIISSELSDVLRSHLSESLKNISVSVTLGCNDKYSFLKTNAGAATLSVIRMNDGGSALLLELTDNEDGENISELIQKAKSFFGINRMFFYISKNIAIDINKLLDNGSGKSEDNGNAIIPPAELFGRDGFCIYADYDFSGECGFIGEFMNKLLGINKIAFFAGKNNGSANSAYFALAASKIKYGGICVSNLCFKLVSSSEKAFIVSGNIEFSIINNMIFSIMCSMAPNKVMLSASAEPKDGEFVKLFGNFLIGRTALILGNEKGNMIVGLICELSLKELYLSAAVQLSILGGAVTPQLISCSFGRLSLSHIINSIVGKDIPGLDALDFIKIDYFDFNMPYKFDINALKSKNISSVVKFFNSYTKAFELDESYTAINTVKNDNGYALIDKKRMRHYYIDDKGSLYLRPQFYYCCVNGMTLADDKKLSAGIFFCAKIIILGIEIKALFSMFVDDGVLAFASVSEINLRSFLVIKGSKFSGSNNNGISIDNDSVLSQFVDNCKDGVLFYLQASKKDVSFYFDGSISLLNGLLTLDAKLYFCRKAFAMDLESTLMGITTRLSFSADFQKFASANFRIYLLFDTSKLEEKLHSFSDKLKKAVERCRQKFQNDILVLEQAKAEVRKLNGEINILDRKISERSNELSGMSWIKKIIMAPIIGCEIAAYEIAKGVLYASLSIAEAALDIATKAVECISKLTQDAIKALDRVITSVTSLFFVRRLKAEIDVKSFESFVEFEIEFVALGKEYKKSWEMHKSIVNDPTHGPNSISDTMSNAALTDMTYFENGIISLDMTEHFDQAELFSNYKKEFDFENVEKVLKCNNSLIEFMNNQYIRYFGESNQLFNESNCDYYDALGTVEANIDISKRVVNIKDLNTISEAVSRCALENADMLAAANTINEKYDSINSIYTQLDHLDRDLSQDLRKKRYDDGHIKPNPQNMMNERIMNEAGIVPKMSLYEYAEMVVKEIKEIYKDAPRGYTNPLYNKEINGIILSARDHFKESDDIE